MASIFQNDQLITAQLTPEGKRIFFSENERFIIHSFAVADPEVNYDLINSSDTDYSIIESFSVFESVNVEKIQNSLLIRKIDNLQDVVKNQTTQNIPSNEIQFVTKLEGTQSLSLGNWMNDQLTVTFALKDPNTLNYFLSTAFLIDFSDFYSNFGLYFNFIPITPAGTINTINNYWFIQSTNVIDSSGRIIPSIIGIDNLHKPIDGVSLANYSNVLGIPALTFSIKIPSELLKPIYNFMIQNSQSVLTANIKISNNDSTITPQSSYYGNSPQYFNISQSIPVHIVF